MSTEVYHREYPTTLETMTLGDYLECLQGMPKDALLLRANDEFGGEDGVTALPHWERRERITYRRHTKKANLLSSPPTERVGLFPVGTADRMRADFERTHKGDEVISVDEKTVVVV